MTKNPKNRFAVSGFRRSPESQSSRFLAHRPVRAIKSLLRASSCVFFPGVLGQKTPFGGMGGKTA